MAVEDPRAEEGSQGQQQSRQTWRRNSSSLRAESKGTQILELIGRTKGATLTDIMKATEWQVPACAVLSHRRQKARGQDRIHKEQSRRARLEEREVGHVFYHAAAP